MKKLVCGMLPFLILTLGLTGCNPVGAKETSLSVVYHAAAIVSFLLLAGCLLLMRKKRSWFILLFSSVFVVNVGYSVLSVSSCLEMALWANRISYLGSVFLPFSMLMIILNITNTAYRRQLTYVLMGVAVLVFLVAASPGILDIYYKDVSFAVVNGVSTLVKVYGPLHPLYLIYLVGYFAAMVAVIVRASVRKTIDTTAHAVIIAIAVLVNIGVWLIEQLAHIEFEFLSVSYIISELFLIGVQFVMMENQRLKDLVAQKEEALQVSKVIEKPAASESLPDAAREYFVQGLETLTPTEREIYNSYLAGTTTKEIMAALEIKENTLKFHNKNLYSKLGVSSRKQLMQYASQIEHEIKS